MHKALNGVLKNSFIFIEFSQKNFLTIIDRPCTRPCPSAAPIAQFRIDDSHGLISDSGKCFNTTRMTPTHTHTRTLLHIYWQIVHAVSNDCAAIANSPSATRETTSPNQHGRPSSRQSDNIISSTTVCAFRSSCADVRISPWPPGTAYSNSVASCLTSPHSPQNPAVRTGPGKLIKLQRFCSRGLLLW